MALMLVQHGKSLPKEVDPQRGLSEEGRLEVKQMAALARDHRVDVAQIYHSGKKRARQSAEIFAAALDPQGGIIETKGLDPLDDVQAFANDGIKPDDNVMIVGHLPFLESLTSYLITGSVDYHVFRFQNAGIICLEYDGEKNSWTIKWTLMPHIG